jgi:hypothetical protein
VDVRSLEALEKLAEWASIVAMGVFIANLMVSAAIGENLLF